MAEQNRDRHSYDIVSISRTGQEKRANYVQDALFISRQQKPSGQFVKVFADMFLRHEAGRRSYF